MLVASGYELQQDAGGGLAVLQRLANDVRADLLRIGKTNRCRSSQVVRPAVPPTKPIPPYRPRYVADNADGSLVPQQCRVSRRSCLRTSASDSWCEAVPPTTASRPGDSRDASALAASSADSGELSARAMSSFAECRRSLFDVISFVAGARSQTAARRPCDRKQPMYFVPAEPVDCLPPVSRTRWADRLLIPGGPSAGAPWVPIRHQYAASTDARRAVGTTCSLARPSAAVMSSVTSPAAPSSQ